MPTIAIVGAGFSGAATAIHLLTRHGDKPLSVMLVNRHANLARGVAYGTHSPSHLLNVPAARMSLFPDRESDFLEFLRQYDSGVDGGSFVARSLYGRYLGTRLKQAIAAAPAMRYTGLTGEVADLGLDETSHTAELRLTDGRRLAADHVVLAVGNYPPADPPVPDVGFYASHHYIRDPWAPGALDHVPLEAPVLMIGTGLTMLDVALELSHRGLSAPMYALSRRGLLPQMHRHLPSMPANPAPADVLRASPSARAYLHGLRHAVREAASRGVDWRDVIGSLRPATRALWQALDLKERRRFLRHVQVYWDVHRHRTAPASGANLEELIRRGALHVYAGRLQRLTSGTEEATVVWRPRGGGPERRLGVAAVINCTGPQSDITRLSDPLIRSLLTRGWIRPDPLRLGLDTDGRGALLDNAGRPSRVLSYTGPLLRARDWEGTAVPELRLAALELADRLAGTW